MKANKMRTSDSRGTLSSASVKPNLIRIANEVNAKKVNSNRVGDEIIRQLSIRTEFLRIFFRSCFCVYAPTNIETNYGVNEIFAFFCVHISAMSPVLRAEAF